jgi:hypothetical protein
MADPLQRLGRHKAHVEADLVLGVFQGPIALDELRAFHEVLAEVLNRHGRCFVLVHSTAVTGTMGPELRRFIAEWNRGHRVHGAAVINESPLIRGAMSLIVAAIRLFRKDELPMQTFADEASARLWIDGLRQQLLRGASAR